VPVWFVDIQVRLCGLGCVDWGIYFCAYSRLLIRWKKLAGKAREGAWEIE
jgi:hypothetical protein